MELVSVDLGGTHARFAIAKVAAGRVVRLGEPVTLQTAEHASLQTAWEAFGQQAGRPLPRTAAIAVASPVGGELIKLTNNPWIIRPAQIAERLQVDRYCLINDFGAVGHAVAQVAPVHFDHVCGPDMPLPDRGTITVCGPGTGLGVAQVLQADGRCRVIETEGGHQDFAPLDAIEDALLRRLRRTFTRASVERVVAGAGIVAMYQTLAEIEGRAIQQIDDRAIWRLALEDGDSLALAALDRFCLVLGAVAGNLALAHGSTAVVIAGGLGLRLKDRLLQSGFEQRFTAKGRLHGRMKAIPVKIITHPQSGLFGAAAAFAQDQTRCVRSRR